MLNRRTPMKRTGWLRAAPAWSRDADRIRTTPAPVLGAFRVGSAHVYARAGVSSMNAAATPRDRAAALWALDRLNSSPNVTFALTGSAQCAM